MSTACGLLVAVGTFLHGFDELVAASDEAAEALDLDGFAQIGGSRVVPRRLAWERFLPAERLRRRIASARVVVCHGGIGILGEAMRAGRPIVAFPRRGPTSFEHPAGDQLPLLIKLAELHPIRLCERPSDLAEALRAALDGPEAIDYELGSDVPDIVAGFLGGGHRGGPACEPVLGRPRR